MIVYDGMPSKITKGGKISESTITDIPSFFIKHKTIALLPEQGVDFPHTKDWAAASSKIRRARTYPKTDDNWKTRNTHQHTDDLQRGGFHLTVKKNVAIYFITDPNDRPYGPGLDLKNDDGAWSLRSGKGLDTLDGMGYNIHWWGWSSDRGTTFRNAKNSEKGKRIEELMKMKIDGKPIPEDNIQVLHLSQVHGRRIIRGFHNAVIFIVSDELDKADLKQ